MGGRAHQPVRLSMWGQDSLEAYSEVLFGYFDNEVGAMRQREAEYGEARERFTSTKITGVISRGRGVAPGQVILVMS